MNEEIRKIVEHIAELASQIPIKPLQTVPTRFSIGDKVFIYKDGKFQEVIVEEISASITRTSSTVKYGFLLSRQPGTLPFMVPENKVFAVKEEILTR